MSSSDPPGKPPADENVVRKRMTAPQMRVPGVPSAEGAPVLDDIPAPRRQTSKSGLNVVRVQEAVEVTGSNLRPAFPPQRVPTSPPPPSPSPPPPLAMDLDDLLGPAPSSPPTPARPPVIAPAPGPTGAPPPPAFGAMAPGSLPRPMAAPPPPASLSTGSLPRPSMAFDPPVEPSGSRPRPTGAMSLDPPVTPEGSGPRPAAITGSHRRPTAAGMSLDPPIESSAPTRRPTGMMSLDPPVEAPGAGRSMSTGSFNRPPPARVVTAPALQALGIADEPPPPPPRWPPPWLENVKAIVAPVAGLVAVLGVVIVIAVATVGDGAGPATFTAEQQQRLVALWLKHGSWGQPRSDEVVGAVAEVGSTVVVPLINRLGSRTARFVVMRDPNEARVAAMPDGTIVITTGALRRLDSEAQLAAVLAHALAHLAINDVSKALEADQGGKAALAALSTSNAQNAASVISSLVETPLGHEVQTMDIALEAMKAAGWSARAMHDAVNRLGAHDGHPATAWHKLHALDPSAMHTLAQASTAGRTNGPEYRTRILDRVGQLGG